MSYENYVEGSKTRDNKDQKNKEKVTGGQTQKGFISGKQKPSVFAPQNSKPSTPENEASVNDGDKKTQVNAKRSKKLNRVGASYNEKSISAAMHSRGMM